MIAEYRTIKEKAFSFSFWAAESYTKAYISRKIQKVKAKVKGQKCNFRAWTLAIQINMKSK